MADEFDPELNEEGQEMPVASAEGEVAAALEASAPATLVEAESPKKSLGVNWVSFLFVALAAVGVFSYGAGSPSPGLLGLGLWGWGLIDLLSQRGALKKWDGFQSGSNLLNLTRAFFLLGLGSLLVLQSLGVMPVFGSNTLLIAGVSFLAGYLLGAYGLEMSGQMKDPFNHALLMGAFGLQFLSFLCFAFIFSVTWASVLACLSLFGAAWAIYRGVLSSDSKVASSIVLVTMLVCAPLGIFLYQEVLSKDLEPVYQASLFIPRFHELKDGLSLQATELAWAPNNTQSDEPGDIRYSDKIAFVDEKKGKKILTVFAQHAGGGDTLTQTLPDEIGRHWWSPLSDSLALTEKDPASRHRILLQLHLSDDGVDAQGNTLQHLVANTLSRDNVVAQDTHGQIFSPDGKSIYFAAPFSQPKHGSTQLETASLPGGGEDRIGSAYKTDPAISADGKSLLYVSYRVGTKFMDIGDGTEGANARVLVTQKEAAHFPAWNDKQTQVCFINHDGMLMIMSANNKSDAVPLTRGNLQSRLWKTEDGSYFTLEKRDTGDFWEIWTMQPDGSGKKKIYAVRATELEPPMWSGDGKRIAFIQRVEDHSQVMTVGKNGEWPRMVFDTKDPLRSLLWSPDSSRLAWFADREDEARQELWVAAKESLTPELAYKSSGSLDSLSWSNGGEHLAFEERWNFSLAGIRIVRPDLYSAQVLDLKSHAARSLTAGGLFARQPAFSPHGNMVAFLAEGASFPILPGNWSLIPAGGRPASLAVAQLY